MPAPQRAAKSVLSMSARSSKSGVSSNVESFEIRHSNCPVPGNVISGRHDLDGRHSVTASLSHRSGVRLGWRTIMADETPTTLIGVLKWHRGMTAPAGGPGTRVDKVRLTQDLDKLDRYL